MTYQALRSNALIKVREEASKYLSIINEVSDLHTPYVNYKGDECFCVHCGEEVNYPCPTIQAIEKGLA